MSAKDEVAAIAKELARHARWAQAIGERELPTSPPIPTKAPASPPAEPPPRRTPVGGPDASPRRAPAPQPRQGPAAAPAARARPAPPADPRLYGVGSPALAAIRDEVGDCQRCALCRSRRTLVFGTGNPKARLVFVGEGPGAEEDAQGIPFVGAAGQLLTRMIGAMGLRREDVYICNVVKCRPPGNRNPEPTEVAACEPFLQAQLRAIEPEVVVALGKFAAQVLLREETPISRLRGNWYEYEGIALMPTFHPAYLLRNEREKAKAWHDLQLVMARLGLRRPS